MFRSFANINYRIWFAGALVSNVGGWMQATAQDWVVLTELTDNDATAMGVTMALQFGPPLVLVSLTGWVADRFDRRHILFATQSALLALAVAVGVLLLNGLMTLPMMFGFALGFGIVNAFDAPARQAFVSDMVSTGDTSNAVALNSASFNLARMIGPAVGGLLIVAIGSGWVFIVNAATFLAMILALSMLRTGLLAPRLKSRSRGGLADGFRYVWGRSDLRVVFVTVFLIGAFGMNFPIFASTMALEFGAGADGYGVLSSVLAIGSLIGALLAARRDRARVRVVILAAGGFGIAAFVSSAMPTYASYAVTLTFTGFMIVTLLTTANGYVQITTEPTLRGRVLALYMAVIMGSTPVGAPIAGWVADVFGPRAAIMLGGTAGFVACAIGVIWVATSGRLRRAENRRFLLTLDETRPLRVVEVDPIEFSDEAAVTTPIRSPKNRDDDR
ncbi:MULTISPECIES: MFS transporter [Microbacterium]|uniref:MFS transporter n=1 Tax=Microbacterium aurugineum TaxID=2851642 RepID=A0ABY4IYX2_9MICO|nr:MULTISPECIES: MFS transporter [Microbacterium]PKQ34339.1 MAG: MFS transporter [Actinobacteria bacterium HGW-Actinobacteria-11]MCK8468836.1 MFS transporter [Microbacterium aurugineum]MCK8478235.1 MFS transporter [Microbacterium aurugineum]MCZ4301938.1 MFS transporter [Microbacterium oxydans]QEA27472.1 MFS transporter [Microbacterium sp. CBA3102]